MVGGSANIQVINRLSYEAEWLPYQNIHVVHDLGQCSKGVQLFRCEYCRLGGKFDLKSPLSTYPCSVSDMALHHNIKHYLLPQFTELLS